MVEEVTAFRASDGSIHDTFVEALTRDADVALRVDIKGEDYITAIFNNRRAVYNALAPLVVEEIELERQSNQLAENERSLT